MPRKTHTVGLILPRLNDASMRPRPDAAENVQEDVELTQEFRAASMRPRPDAAENLEEFSQESLQQIMLQ